MIHQYSCRLQTSKFPHTNPGGKMLYARLPDLELRPPKPDQSLQRKHNRLVHEKRPVTSRRQPTNNRTTYPRHRNISTSIRRRPSERQTTARTKTKTSSRTSGPSRSSGSSRLSYLARTMNANATSTIRERRCSPLSAIKTQCLCLI